MDRILRALSTLQQQNLELPYAFVPPSQTGTANHVRTETRAAKRPAP